jgi:ABC transporter substrate binding protein (PQQ-dependent alcohol dehydrogenase system)
MQVAKLHITIFILFFVLMFSDSQASSNQAIHIAMISSENISYPGTPNHLVRPANEGIAGAQLAIPEANLTGRFLGYSLSLTNKTPSELTENDKIVVLNLNEKDAIKYIPQLTKRFSDTLFINVRSQNNQWRTKSCHLNLFHTIPSFSMQADALGQWLLQRRMQKLFVVKGEHPADVQYVDSIKRMAKRFKIDIVEEKLWTGDFDLRRVAYKEVPQFTKTHSPYNALFVSDYQREFGYALPYNTYNQAPVIGDFGLQAVTWHHTIEQWGALQLQNRFIDTFNRNMTSLDFTAYLAIRAIAYAAQINQAFDAVSLSDTMLSEKFVLAAYKGRKLSFRPQNRQLRMPIALTHDSGLLTNAPLEGFLHPITDLDTLGHDRHERCQ